MFDAIHMFGRCEVLAADLENGPEQSQSFTSKFFSCQKKVKS